MCCADDRVGKRNALGLAVGRLIVSYLSEVQWLAKRIVWAAVPADTDGLAMQVRSSMSESKLMAAHARARSCKLPQRNTHSTQYHEINM